VARNTLRIEHSAAFVESRSVRISLFPETGRIQECTVDFEFALSADDRERLRWYWESYLDRPDARSAGAATVVEQRLDEIGRDLFETLFVEEEARQIWDLASQDLRDLRVEVVSAPPRVCEPVPWELMRPPDSEGSLAVCCRQMTEGPSGSTPSSAFDSAQDGRLRVLTVLWRPPGTAADSFRSAAREAVRLSSQDPTSRISWDVLQPPTFGRLSSVLLEAESLGEHYHVVHFDGVGVLADLEEDVLLDAALGKAEIITSRTISGVRGALAFDNPMSEGVLQLVDAAALSELLIESRVSVLTLSNACAAADIADHREPSPSDFRPVDCFRSVARSVCDAGLTGALEAPYNLDPQTAGRAFLNIYEGLARGLTLGEAASRQRKTAAADPLRRLAGRPVTRMDWPVMRVYESVRARLLRAAPQEATDELTPAEAGVGQQREAGPLPFAELGFVGQDDALVHLDRIFCTRPAALIRGEAGLGKSALAAEYARWSVSTGALDGPVIYSPFAEHRCLVSLLDQLATVFAEPLRANGYDWDRMAGAEREDVALHVLRQIPVLWIWDGVESVDGLSDIGVEPWDQEDREELVRFVHRASDSQARFLLTSRNSEPWLDRLAESLELLPLPMRERLLLTQAILDRNNAAANEIENWRPLLAFTQGNPLAIRILLQEAVAEGVRTRRQVEAFVAGVYETFSSTAESELHGLSETLAASLGYVLHNGFSEAEQEVLALLHLFRGSVDTALLEAMSDSETPWGMTDLRSQREFQKIAERKTTTVFDRAAGFGLLRRLSGAAYWIEPALPWFLGKLFDQRYPAQNEGRFATQLAGLARQVSVSGRIVPLASRAATEPAEANVETAGADGENVVAEAAAAPTPSESAKRAFVEASARFGAGAARRLRDGDHSVAADLAAAESNLRRCCQFSRENGWWESIVGAVEGLGVLYDLDNRVMGWQKLLEDLSPDCVNRTTQEALPGRERYWRALTEQRVRLARKRGMQTWAVEMQNLVVRYDRRMAADATAREPESLTPDDREAIRTLAFSLNHLGTICREDGRPSPAAEEQAVELCEKLGDRERAARWAFELGASYTEVLSIRDLAKAERWLRRGLDLSSDERSEKARFLGALGQVAWERFRYARQSENPETELLRHLNDARNYYQRALEHDAADDYACLAGHNQQLGHVSYSLGDIDRALPYYRDSIRYDQIQGNIFGAARTRFNLAIALRDVGRLGEARRYALAAFSEMQAVSGDIAEGLLDRSRRLVGSIEGALEEKRRQRAALSAPKEPAYERFR